MKQELFNTYFLDVSSWIKKSRELTIAARYLIAIENDIFKTGNDVVDTYEIKYHPFQAWASLGSAASLMLGLALENLIKGYLINIGKITIDENNKIQGLTGNHDLFKMIKETDFELSEEDELSVKRLTFQLQSLSKYHLAKNPRKQAEFSGVIEYSEKIYYLVLKIAKQILPKEFQESFFELDSGYDHIPSIPNFSESPFRVERNIRMNS